MSDLNVKPIKIMNISGELKPLYSFHPKANAYISNLFEKDIIHQQVKGLVLNEFIQNETKEKRAEHEKIKFGWSNSAAGIEQKLDAEPYFIKTYHQRKLNWLKKNRSTAQSNAFLIRTVKKVLLRLDAVRETHTARPYKILSAYYGRLWPHLSAMSPNRIKSLANEISARLNDLLTELIESSGGSDAIDKESMLSIYRQIALETFSLRVNVPGWDALKPKHGSDDYDLTPAFAALGRMTNADWWERQIWRLRGDWREALLRASNQVHKKAHPYISHDALSEWVEQRRKNSEFFKSHELEDDEGNKISLEAMVLASVSNPVLRRHELMTRMQGVELIAESRGDIGVFFTLTCPSKYHSSTHSGRPNDKWNLATPPIAQRYLTKLWANIGSKLNRKGLRLYGFRVAEPHHDSTPHWHLLLFMAPSQRKQITRIIHEYATREDRGELKPDARARFNFKIMDPRKGSATAYIAKYISKNIDGYALDGELDDETGKPLKETAKFAMAWASRYRIRQYQPIGQPSVTVWRELRKLNNQLVARLMQSKNYDPNKPLLNDPMMDKVLAAADVGCWASFIDYMGGVLIPRNDHLVAIAYEEKDEPNLYGEIVDRIFGIFSTFLGEKSTICTREKTWKIVAKTERSDDENGKAKNAQTISKGASAFIGGFDAPWSSVNNSPLADFLTNATRGIDRDIALSTLHFALEKESINFGGDNTTQKTAKKNKKQSLPQKLTQLVHQETHRIGVFFNHAEIENLLSGNDVQIKDNLFRLMINGHKLKERKWPSQQQNAKQRSVKDKKRAAKQK